MRYKHKVLGEDMYESDIQVAPDRNFLIVEDPKDIPVRQTNVKIYRRSDSQSWEISSPETGPKGIQIATNSIDL